MSRHRIQFEHLEPDAWKEDPGTGELFPQYFGVKQERIRGRQMLYDAFKMTKAQLAKQPNGPTLKDQWT